MGIACSVAICSAWLRSSFTIISRSAGSNESPAISSAQATVSAVISAPSATRAQSTPGRSVEPRPIDAK
jgi:hypothetical protein